MKLLNKILAMGLVASVGMAACEKADKLPFYNNGKAPVFTASATAVAVQPADSNKTAITFSWLTPRYATGATNVKYLLQIDSTGRNFSKATVIEIKGDSVYSIIGKDLNTILLSYGFEFGKAYDMDVRLISSYGNNNERLTSNVLKIRMTPYKVPPRVVLPSTGKLFIVGDATAGSWSNPVPTPSQELDRIDETTFGGIFNLFGGGSYLILPENGQWKKYSVANGSLNNLWQGGDFGSELADNFPAPPVDGWYKIILDFQKGQFKVNGLQMPDSLYTIGDATAGGWNNANDNNTLKAQYLTQVKPWIFEGTQVLTGGANIKFISKISFWQPQFGRGSKDGELGSNFGSGNDPGTITIPSNGTYKIQVNFLTMTYTVTKQ
ncbi:SusE domain-containing protein [Phnomibacter sp. MR]|uniref:SusE domain-containing protein n=1 Tax=Phnomibacter sp. MR TaxID=3042318 RepID=UPI003A7F9F8E